MKTSEITKQEDIIDCIRACNSCVVSLVDKHGFPYAFPMNFSFVDGVFYLHSGLEGEKISAIENNPNACLTFVEPNQQLVFQHEKVACSYSMRGKSVIAIGKIEFVDEFEEKINCLNKFMSHYTKHEFTYSTPAVNNVKVWRMVPEKITARFFGIAPKHYYKLKQEGRL